EVEEIGREHGRAVGKQVGGTRKTPGLDPGREPIALSLLPPGEGLEWNVGGADVREVGADERRVRSVGNESGHARDDGPALPLDDSEAAEAWSPARSFHPPVAGPRLRSVASASRGRTAPSSRAGALAAGPHRAPGLAASVHAPRISPQVRCLRLQPREISSDGFTR